MVATCPLTDRMGFLLYDSRSGSTHLASLLDAHPELVVSFESEFLLDALAEEKREGQAPVGEKLHAIVRRDKKLYEWGGEVAEQIMEQEPEIHAPALLEKIFAATLHERKPEARWLILKQGLLTAYLPELVRHWPNGVFIHIYRDGRGVFNSKRKALNIDTGQPMQSDPHKAARKWVGVQEAVHAFPRHAKLVNIQYEQLIAEEEATIAEIFQHLGVSAVSAETLAADGYADNIPEAQKGIHTLVGKGPDLTRLDIWKTELEPELIEAFEAGAGDMLQELGYPLSQPPKQDSLLKRLFAK